jgi:hypothetical protein
MKKSTFITFGLMVFVLAVVIPWLAFRGSGDANTGAQKVPAHLKAGQALFETNCGEKQAKATASRVLNAQKEGVDSQTPGRMPPAILNPDQQEEVAEFVGAVAGEG